MKKQEALITRAACPICSKTFKNVFSVNAHIGHCKGISSTKQFANKRPWNKGKISSSLEEIFTDFSKFSTGYVKKTILTHGLKDWKCALCGLSTWLDKPLILELDHINGKNRDHRLENLRFLCPNCHSQTSTFRGRNTKKIPVPDEVLLLELKSNNIGRSLSNVGLSASGANYERCKRLLVLHQLIQVRHYHKQSAIQCSNK